MIAIFPAAASSARGARRRLAQSACAPRLRGGARRRRWRCNCRWLHSVQFGGSYIAQSQRLLDASGAERGARARRAERAGGAARRSGQALVGISAADYTAAAVAQGAPFRIVSVAMQKNPFAIASLPANPVNVPADLAGKKIGMALANTPVLQALCTLNNVDITQIEIMPTQYDAAAAAGGRGRLPAVLGDRPAGRDGDPGDRGGDDADGRPRLCRAFADLHRHRRQHRQPPGRARGADARRGAGLGRLQAPTRRRRRR